MSFRRIYPGNARIMFDGGLNTKFEKNLIPDNESPDCLNVIFTNGAVETRGGFQKLNTTPIGSFAIDGLYTRRSDTGAETMIAFANGTGWQLAITTFSTIPSAQSVFTSDTRIAAAQYENHIFFGNGGVVPYKYNGTDFTRHGVPAPSQTISAVCGGAGVLTGDYRYKVTFVNSQLAEGNPSSSTATLTVAAGQISLTSLPVAPQSHGVSSRRIYRTAAGGTTWKRVTEIANNTTTTYNDNLADGSLGVDAPSDNGEPPNWSVICYHQNRLFMNDPANPNFVWYTNVGEPYTVASSNFVRAGDDAGDIVKGLSVYNNSVVIHCEKSQWLIYMADADPDNWRLIKIRSSYGSKCHFGSFDYQNKQMFPAFASDKLVGFAALDGDTIDTSTTLLTQLNAGSEMQSDKIEPDVFNINDGKASLISSIVYKNKAYVTVPYGVNQQTNNRTYVFDFSYSRVSKSQAFSWVPWSGIGFSQFTIYSGRLYGGVSAGTGYVYQLESSVYNDDGAAINSYYWTAEMSADPKEINFTKDWRYANILLDLSGQYFMDLNYRVDSDKGDGNQVQIDLNPGGSLWGSAIFGTSLWGGGSNQSEVRQFFGPLVGKRIQLKFSNQNTAGQKFKVHGLNLAYNVKGYR